MLKEKIENALNESRILALVAEVMLGFEYQTVFQPGFRRLTAPTQHLRLIGLFCMLLAMALFLAPAVYHQIVQAGHLSEKLNRFVSKVTTVGLIPFAVALGIDVYTVSERVLPPFFAVVTGVLSLLTAFCFWYGMEMMVLYREKRREKESPTMEDRPTELKDRIKFVLMEARVVLPGAQALLGFQFAAVLTDSFEKLPGALKMVHLGSLLSVAFCTILLMTPAAYHRIVEHGDSTERMEALSRRMVLASMAFLAPGIAGDVLIVTERVVHSMSMATTAGGLTLSAFYGFWFGYMIFLRARNRETTERPGLSSPPLPGK